MAAMTNALSASVPPATPALEKPEDAKKPHEMAVPAVDDEHEIEPAIEPEIEQDRVPEGTQLTPYKFPLNVDDVSAWQELLDASAGDEQAQRWYKSMLQQAEEIAAAAEPAAAAGRHGSEVSEFEAKYGCIRRRRVVTGFSETPPFDDVPYNRCNQSWVKCLNHRHDRHDQDDIDKKALEDRFIFIYDKPAVKSAAAALARKPVAASEIPQPQEIAVVEPQMEPAAEPAAAASETPKTPEPTWYERYAEDRLRVSAIYQRFLTPQPRPESEEPKGIGCKVVTSYEATYAQFREENRRFLKEHMFQMSKLRNEANDTVEDEGTSEPAVELAAAPMTPQRRRQRQRRQRQRRQRQRRQQRQRQRQRRRRR